ncbi:phosphatase PAP2 family protein [Liquorilactobacillus uvarum]|uniref:Phosphatidylglycerophosphatase B n=1 Tax=Liquorilactobacillus uvarum DSM 19971 TaxID=1423812 RepID=A0A0R1PV65_9LACO|nr:phosphatase PAP2 family protein [Liquorilactobacillus uvarum]KRL36455.1 phosphatidylglycerophosphatase B [Liquorilactobacillus uvarum DSM 19971]
MNKNKYWLITGLISSILFVILVSVICLNQSWIIDLDSQFQRLPTMTVTTIKNQFFSIITFFGSPIVNICLTCLIALGVWFRQNQLLNVIWIISAQVIGDMLVFLFKEIIRRPRPNNQVMKDTGFSFPSGHTFSTAIVVLIILFIVIPWLEDQEIQFAISLLSICWLGVVAFSRLYLRNHFLTDVLGSILLALAWWEIMRGIYFTLYNPALESIKLKHLKERKK